MNNLHSLRSEYTRDQLLENAVDADPIKQFQIWMDDVLKAGISEPNAMTLSTISNGKPASRVVLLKDVNANGFTFFTNYLSSKGKQMEQNPTIALTFFWKELQRQVRIEGNVSKVSEEESETYFNSRPVESRIGAIVSAQSSLLTGRKELDEAYEKAVRDYEQTGDLKRPKHWGGYLVTPHSFEFWQGRASRLHDRILYERASSASWIISRLSP